MQNIIKSIVVCVALCFSASVVRGDTVAVTVQPNSCTNVCIGAATLLQMTLAAGTATNVLVNVFDNTTNTLAYATPQYSNVVSYATNVIYTWTNYFGQTLSTTNIGLVDTYVNVATNVAYYPVRLSMAALASTSAKADNLNTFFVSGIQVTNASSGVAVVTATFKR